MPSFDVVSKLDHHEVDNAIDQAKRETSQRFDFKGTNTTIVKNEDGIVIRSSAEARCVAALEVLKDKFARRKISMKAIDAGEPKPGGGNDYRMLVKLREGIEQELAKTIVKFMKEQKELRVQVAIQGDELRISHKKRDVLQAAMNLIKEQDYDLPLQFKNFRD